MLAAIVFTLLASLILISRAQVGQAPVFVPIGPDPPTGHVHRILPSGREYLLNIPEGYDHSLAHPLVLSFHGAGGTSLKEQRITQLSTPGYTIAGMPYLAAYPQGVNNTEWNMRRIWQGAPYGNETVDDIQFVKDVIEDVSLNYTINQRRLYACGKSNGGGFTALLSCRPDTAKLFAAFAPVSPALYAGTHAFSGCKPGRPVPILHSHGVVDTITPFYGRTPEEGSFGPEPDVRVWRARWAKRNGCRDLGDDDLPKPTEITYPFPNTTLEIWRCGDNKDAEVLALSISNLGHAWPTVDGLDTVARPNQTANFDFTSEYLLDFFSAHTLPEGI